MSAIGYVFTDNRMLGNKKHNNTGERLKLIGILILVLGVLVLAKDTL